MLWCVQFQQLNVARKPRDELRIRCSHDDWSLSDTHEGLNGSPEASVLTQNHVDLQITHAYTTLLPGFSAPKPIQFSPCTLVSSITSAGQFTRKVNNSVSNLIQFGTASQLTFWLIK